MEEEGLEESTALWSPSTKREMDKTLTGGDEFGGEVGGGTVYLRWGIVEIW
jgi:hypothetical protein